MNRYVTGDDFKFFVDEYLPTFFEDQDDFWFPLKFKNLCEVLDEIAFGLKFHPDVAGYDLDFKKLCDEYPTRFKLTTAALVSLVWLGRIAKRYKPRFVGTQRILEKYREDAEPFKKFCEISEDAFDCFHVDPSWVSLPELSVCYLTVRREETNKGTPLVYATLTAF